MCSNCGCKDAETKMHPDWCSNCGMKNDGCINLGYGDWYCMNFLNNRETYDGRYDKFRGEEEEDFGAEVKDRHPTLSKKAKSEYVFPERNAYPIGDEKHAMLALVYSTWPNNKKDASEVRRKVFQRYPQLRTEFMDGKYETRNAESFGAEDMITITGIDWETDGEDVDLPTTMEVPADLENDEIADYLSDQIGWLVNGFVMGAESLEDYTPEELATSNVNVGDITVDAGKGGYGAEEGGKCSCCGNKIVNGSCGCPSDCPHCGGRPLDSETFDVEYDFQNQAITTVEADDEREAWNKFGMYGVEEDWDIVDVRGAETFDADSKCDRLWDCKTCERCKSHCGCGNYKKLRRTNMRKMYGKNIFTPDTRCGFDAESFGAETPCAVMVWRDGALTECGWWNEKNEPCVYHPDGKDGIEVGEDWDIVDVRGAETFDADWDNAPYGSWDEAWSDDVSFPMDKKPDRLWLKNLSVIAVLAGAILVGKQTRK